MDFASLILFMALYYIRPQEWIHAVAVLKPVTVVMAMAIFAMLTRYRGFTFRDLFQTSHDWLMLAYYVWIVVASPTHFDTLRQVFSLFMFYLVTVQTLSRLERIQTFLIWWTALILLVAALAVASQYGFDPMGSYDLTHGAMKDRLVLNTSIFNNPNALGHSVYPVVLMLYFLLFWQRPVFMKIFALPLFGLALSCIYLTLSKGTFVAGFATAVCALSFGRRRIIQITILLLALTVGWGAVKSLPRMKEIAKAQTDKAIQGRVAAFTYGLSTLRGQPMGIGYNRWEGAFLKENKYQKSSHSTYVQVGAELGYPGLFLYLAILYCCLRTLVTARTASVREERVRRILFVLLISYTISGWMVNFTYRATFFLMAGATAAFHRQLFERTRSKKQAAPAIEPGVDPDPATVLPALEPAPLRPALAMNALNQPPAVATAAGTSAAVVDIQAEVEPVGLHWTQFRWFDWVIVLLLMQALIGFWSYVIQRF